MLGRRGRGVVVFLLFLALVLPSCKRGTKRRRSPSVTKVKVRRRAQKTKSFRVPKNFSYRPYGLRDPFSPPKRFSFVIGDVVGVVEEKGGFSMLIRTPKGSLKTVRKGDVVGGSKVVDLKGNMVLLEREVSTPWGGKRIVRRWVPLKVGGRR